MNVIIHDLQEASWQELGIKLNEKDVIIGKGTDIAAGRIGDLLQRCRQIVLVSRCVYGGFSPFVQEMLEKCREQLTLLPELRHGRIRHKSKNEDMFNIACYFYGDNISHEEEQSLRSQSISNAVLLQAKAVRVELYGTMDKLKQLKHAAI